MENTQELLVQYVNGIKEIYGTHLAMVLLYGSYARGDFNEESDIDIMILVDLQDGEIKEYAEKLSELTFEMNLQNDIMLMPMVKNIEHFEYWVRSYPFYGNVKSEGVTLYAA
ncbi:MAG: nucleotidyltransferase domain-containing protein [Lachnospiraceae bacterium]|nr:nucleotidyltransferase domain-containing protein [Lachnospiraceae bacterium]